MEYSNLIMYIEDAIRVFGSKGEIARLLSGLRHRSAIYQWKPRQLIPLGAAVLLARRSNGQLLVNDVLYEKERLKRSKRLNQDRLRAMRALRLMERSARKL